MVTLNCINPHRMHNQTRNFDCSAVRSLPFKANEGSDKVERKKTDEMKNDGDDRKGKNVFSGIMSFLAPGLGQLCNGEKEKGWKMSAVAMAGYCAATAVPLLGIPLLAYNIYAAHDAYKYNGKGLENSEENTLSGTLNCFIPGAGQLCNGKVAKGLGFMAVGIPTSLMSMKAALTGNKGAKLLFGISSAIISRFAVPDAYRNETEFAKK